MTEWMPRSAWTSSARGGARLDGSVLRGLACHWPGSSTSAFGVESAGNVAGRLRGWRRYHVDGRGWSDIGYNFAVDQAGRVWDLRGSGRVGAHAASASNLSANHQYVGVLFIVGAGEQPTDEMTRAFWDFRRDVFLDAWPDRTDVRGHGEVPGASTACPGPAVLRLTNNEPEDDEMTPEDRQWISEQIDGLRDLINRRTGDVVAHPYQGDDNPNYHMANAIADIWKIVHALDIDGVKDLVERRTGDVVETPYDSADNPTYYLANAVAHMWRTLHEMAGAGTARATLDDEG